MPFLDTNVALRLSKRNKFQVGINNVDPGEVIEKGILAPWPADPAASWLYYECAVGVMLDSGIVVHNRLPQVDRDADSLASCNFDDPNLDRLTGFGVNLKCLDQYTDIVQRMGHARYWFRLWGQALRAGYQIPIPGIKKIGGVEAIPYDKNPQWATCHIAPGGNYGGVILWRAQWSLWYTTAVQPKNNYIPATDPSAHIRGDTPPPKNGIQAPYSQPDDNALKSGPAQTVGTLNIIR